MDTKIYGFYANVEMLEQEDVFRRLFCGLSRERQQKTEQIKPKMERARSLMAGALLDAGLLRLHKLRERDEAISYGAQGKPFLRDHPGIHFNLSHSGDYALAVFAPAAVGCDIQKREQAKNSERIAARFFSEGEQRALEQGADFYRIWARKESYLKLTGEGLALDMRSFCVTGEMCFVDGPYLKGEMAGAKRVCSDEGTETSINCVSLLEAPCRFSDFELEDYSLAICYASAESYPAEWVEITSEELLEMYPGRSR